VVLLEQEVLLEHQEQVVCLEHQEQVAHQVIQV
jgi:hypothetical protein